MQDDPFPDRPTVEELDDNPDDDDDDPVYAVARVIVRAAREYPEFREEFLDDESVGSAYRIDNYDQELFQKMAHAGITSAQGILAESTARETLKEEFDVE